MKNKKMVLIILMITIFSIGIVYYSFDKKRKTNATWQQAFELLEKEDYMGIYEHLDNMRPRNQKEEELVDMANYYVFASGLYKVKDVFGDTHFNLYEVEDALDELIRSYLNTLDYIKIAEEKEYPVLDELLSIKEEHEIYLNHYFELSPEETVYLHKIKFNFETEEEYKNKFTEFVKIGEKNRYNSPPIGTRLAKNKKETVVDNQINSLVLEDISTSYNGALKRYEVTGSVYNSGDDRFQFIEIKLLMLDSNDNVIDTDTHYVNSSDTLLPNERKRFNFPIYTDVSFDKISWQIYDYTTE